MVMKAQFCYRGWKLPALLERSDYAAAAKFNITGITYYGADNSDRLGPGISPEAAQNKLTTIKFRWHHHYKIVTADKLSCWGTAMSTPCEKTLMQDKVLQRYSSKIKGIWCLWYFRNFRYRMLITGYPKSFSIKTSLVLSLPCCFYFFLIIVVVTKLWWFHNEEVLLSRG